MELLTASEVAELDRRAAEDFGLPVRLLMENAGQQVARVARALWSERPILILAGKGNNGGDGLVAARYLHDWGLPVRVVLVADPAGLAEPAAANWRLLEPLGIPHRVWQPQAVGEEAMTVPDLAESGLVIDALLGTGVRGAVREPFASIIAAVNGVLGGRPDRPVLAVDLPSGLEADTGREAGEAIRATTTVTFTRPKRGLYLQPGRSLAGRIVLAVIGIPEVAVSELAPELRLSTPERVQELLPARPPWAHKGDFGHVVVVAGSRAYAGAGLLTAQAALAAGAGLVTLAVPEPVWAVAAGRLPEVMVRPFPADVAGGFHADAAQPLLDLAAGADVLALGPGLGRGDGARTVVNRLLATWQGPLVLDADGLNLTSLEEIRQAPGSIVLTPHPGEAARLLSTTAAGIEIDRMAAARRLAQESEATALLKGAGTLTTGPGSPIWLNPTGNSGMATAGSGDVLTGIIAALLAQELEPLAAAQTGAFLHGLAGDLAAHRAGPVGLTAAGITGHVGEASFRLEHGQWPRDFAVSPYRRLD